ncbi:hypothetical protein B0H13DRAFT_1851559 [Mycena leptocephala]|nr:hypothetical protein B0H13DRAFT_1851559 [Mycena leptocephala]
MKDAIVDLFQSSNKLEACPMWDQFLLAIDYKNSTLRDQKPFKASDVDINYGPQGEFVIYSCLLRLIAELDMNEERLEDFCSNLHTFVTEGNSHEQFDYENNDLATSNYLTLDDFMHFLVLPFVVVSLILEDQPGLDSFYDALFEKTNSNEYGDLFFPEDITEPSICARSSRHRIRSYSPAPPQIDSDQTEAKTETLKIHIPPPAVVEEGEITLDDFQCLAQNRSDKPSVKANMVNPSSYETRSKSNAKEQED